MNVRHLDKTMDVIESSNGNTVAVVTGPVGTGYVGHEPDNGTWYLGFWSHRIGVWMKSMATRYEVKELMEDYGWRLVPIDETPFDA